jgi:outer membrane protein OmpA-like peptidoglycan-associated protein
MKIFQSLLVVIIAISLSACTVRNAPTPLSCAIAGAGIGAAGTATLYAEDNDNKDSDEVAAAAGIGAAAGALIGLGVCMLFNEEAAPPPAPKPAPLPEILEDVGDPCEGVVHLQMVNFGFDSATVTDDAKPILTALAAALQRCPQRLVRVEAHTDSIGSEAYNLSLSDRRASSVYMFLTENGVPSSMLESKGFGEAEPLASNETAAGRASNRRVELEPLR